MSTLRISNIEAKSVPASATIDEKVKITNSSGDPLVFIDGKTSGITTVGINTTDPNITFDANSNIVVTGIITATKFVGTIEPTNLTISGDLSISDKIIHSGDTNTALRFPAADTFSVETGGSERFRIDPNGHITVGVGANALDNTYLTIPRYTVDGDAAKFISLRNDTAPADVTFVKSRSTTYGSYAAIQDDDIVMSINSDIDTGSAFSFRGTFRSIFDSATGGVHFMWGSGGAPSTTGEKMRLTSTGNLGIGTISPAYNLDISNSSGEAQLRIDSSSGNHGMIRFSQAGTNKSYIQHVNGNHLAFGPGGSEKLRITNIGSVGIGTNNPADILDINSDSASAVTNMYLRNHANLGGAALNLYTQGTYASPQYRAIIGCSDAGGNIRMGAHSNHELLLLTNNSPRVTVKTNGDVEIADGNLIVANGHGIDFSNTANGSGFSQELLDDYEEGNFNSTDVSGGGLTLTYNNTGRYVKVGRQVYVIFDINYPSNSDSANISRVSTPYQAHIPYGGGWVGWNDLGKPMQVHVSGTNVYFMDNDSSGTAKHLYNSELSGRRIIGGYMLMTNS